MKIKKVRILLEKQTKRDLQCDDFWRRMMKNKRIALVARQPKNCLFQNSCRNLRQKARRQSDESEQPELKQILQMRKRYTYEKKKQYKHKTVSFDIQLGKRYKIVCCYVFDESGIDEEAAAPTWVVCCFYLLGDTTLLYNQSITRKYRIDS